jgi:hypothetical protein
MIDLSAGRPHIGMDRMRRNRPFGREARIFLPAKLWQALLSFAMTPEAALH